MNDDAFAAARAALVEARRSPRCVESLPTAWVPQRIDEAVRLQDAVAAELGAVRGWKVSALTAEQQRAVGVDCPLRAPLLAPWVRDSGTTLPLADFIRPRLECEFAFELSGDLPPRAEPYARAEVEAAIASLRIVIEVVDSRLPADSPFLMELADDLNNGAFIVGPASPRWRSLRYAEQRIVLRRKVGGVSAEVGQGDGGAVLDGDPVGAVVLLANLPSRGGRGLCAGDIVTTGSCTGVFAVTGSADFEADFGDLGCVKLAFATAT